MTFLGIDIGGTNIKACISDENDNITKKINFKTEASRGFQASSNLLISTIERFLENEEIPSGIGIGVPGLIDSNGVIINSPNLPGWESKNLKKLFETKFNIPVIVENDANMASFSETVAGSGKDFNSFLYITLGTGIGGSIIIDRKLFKGPYGFAGEIGHIHIDGLTYLNKSGLKHGTFESLAGKDAIIRRYTYLKGTDIINWEDSVSRISELADCNDPIAIECMEITGKIIGTGIASAMNFLGINKAVIGGGISNASDYMWYAIVEATKNKLLKALKHDLEIRKALFLNEAGMKGAALISKSSINTKQDYL